MAVTNFAEGNKFNVCLLNEMPPLKLQTVCGRSVIAAFVLPGCLTAGEEQQGPRPHSSWKFALMIASG